MKQWFLLLTTITTVNVFANNIESSIGVINTNAIYISKGNFLQNTYSSMMSGGGTQKITENQFSSQNFAEHLFADGAWNVMVGSAGQYMTTDSFKKGFPSFGYGANLFGQTGSVAGFSVGVLFSVANPFYAKDLNRNAHGQNPEGANYNFLPANKQVTLSEAYLEYQYSNIVQADCA